MNNSMMEEMRQETTEYALFHVNKTPELFEQFMEVKEENNNLQTNIKKCMLIAEKWASEHKDEFGDLFVAELPLVRWNTLLRGL